MGRKKSWEEHIEDFRCVHGDRYKYLVEQSMYNGVKTKTKITCKEHGDFEQSINNHKNGIGCPYCAGKKVKGEGSSVLCDDGVIRKIISRKNAKNQSKGKYFTGTSCGCGHLSERYTTTGQCISCLSEYYFDNKGIISEYKTRYQKDNKKLISEYRKKYQKDNKEKINSYQRNRRATDENFRTLEICRSLLRRALKAASSTKESRTHDLLGYCNKQLKESIESKFIYGMSWDNYGEWHIDHVIPISRCVNEMGITNPKKINSLDNLIPMWDSHNLEKSSKTLEEYLDDRPDLYVIYGHFLKENA